MKKLPVDHSGSNMFIGFLLILGILILGLVISHQPPQPELLTLTHEDFNFTLDYPSKWVAESYGESGYKGNHDVRLRISRPMGFLGDPSTFVIRIESRAIKNPSLQDVVNWSNESLDNLYSSFGFEEIFLEEENLNGHLIMRRQYAVPAVKYEEVLIARSEDMIIISLAISKDYFSRYHADFNRIVESFRPSE